MSKEIERLYEIKSYIGFNLKGFAEIDLITNGVNGFKTPVYILCQNEKEARAYAGYKGCRTITNTMIDNGILRGSNTPLIMTTSYLLNLFDYVTTEVSNLKLLNNEIQIIKQTLGELYESKNDISKW